MIELQGVCKRFGTFVAVKDLNLTIEQGEFLTLLGPSGCGKTTTLRMLAGFESPSEGEILMDGISIVDKQPYDRNVNTVFQNYALFPHMSVRENVAFGLRMKRVSSDEIGRRVNAALEMVQLSQFADRQPRQLSGGQQQRVAIARAVVNHPRVLLLDEPLGALDLKMRKQMQLELKRLHGHLGITFVYVTHDQEEALIMSDRIGIMQGGVLEQVGTPREIYEAPRTAFVADFIGEANLITVDIRLVVGETAVAEAGGASFRLRAPAGLTAGREVVVAARPEHCTLYAEITDELEGDDSLLDVLLVERVYAGSIIKTVVRLQSGSLVHVTDPAGQEIPFVQGRRAFLKVDEGKAVILEE